MMLLFAFSSLLAVASCTDINTLILCNQGLPKPVSSVKLLEEYAKDPKSYVVLQMRSNLPTDYANENFKEYLQLESAECADLAAIYYIMQREGRIAEYKDENEIPDNTEGLWLLDAQPDEQAILLSFETTLRSASTNGNENASKTSATSKPTTPGQAASDTQSTQDNQANKTTESSTDSKDSTKPQAASETSSTVAVTSSNTLSVQRQSVVAKSEATTGAQQSAENVKMLVVLTKCDLKMQVTEEQMSKHSNIPRKHGSGFTPAIAFTSLLPFLLMMS